MAHIEYFNRGIAKKLIIDPARVEMITPSQREQGSQTKSLGDQCHENVHWRTDQFLKLKMRALTDGDMRCWMDMITYTKCGTCTLDIRPHRSWHPISYALVTRQNYSYNEDGCGLWLFNVEFELAEKLT